MPLDQIDPGSQKALDECLGYLNFSAGAPDPHFQQNINQLFEFVETSGGCSPPRLAAWQMLGNWLSQRLEQLDGASAAFAEVQQARQVIAEVFQRVLPYYRRFHRDLLFHLTDDELFRPFFLARVFEATLSVRAALAELPPAAPAVDGGEAFDPLARAVVARLNDYVGHRPVAVLNTPQKIEPYPHEWVRPIPWYLRGAGVATGRYQAIIAEALAILRTVPDELLEHACFDWQRLDALAVDPRAYDFDHPVNKRPNYHFGQWDPHQIDHRGDYRRFVLQQVTLDVLLERVESSRAGPRHELLWEGAAVLAGTMLMASGISGRGPETHDSSVTLANLLPHIAAYRDAYYDWLLANMTGPHAARLAREAQSLLQPLGGARQELNQGLARRRARQLQHVHLATLYARMGYPEASQRQAAIVSVASARIRCELHCRLVAVSRAIEHGRLPEAAEALAGIEDLLHRGVECGALVDPWNILGFQGQYGVFQAMENSVHDHRVDELIELVGQTFNITARLAGQAAAVAHPSLKREALERLRSLACWWDQFASTEVSGVEGISGAEAFQAAENVARALGAWHQAGSAAGDVAFWREHVEGFESPKSYALVAEALLDQRDFVAAMALLVQWLSRADEVPLEQDQYSLYRLTEQWMLRLHSELKSAADAGERARAWSLGRKFLDFLEANAGELWEAPRLERAVAGEADEQLDALFEELDDLAGPLEMHDGPNDDDEDDHGDRGDAFAEAYADDDDDDDDDDDVQRYQAAYEDVTYEDSTGDGVEGDLLEDGASQADYALDYEGPRLMARLGFLTTIARLWAIAASGRAAWGERCGDDESIAAWLEQSRRRRDALRALVEEVQLLPIPKPLGSASSLVEYDRRRIAKLTLLERIASTHNETAAATRCLLCLAPPEADGRDEPWERLAAALLQAISSGRVEDVRQKLPPFSEAIRRHTLLYLPLGRGGKAGDLLAAQVLNQTLREILAGLPRLGLLSEAFELLVTAHDAEREHPVGGGAVTEFDRLFHLVHGEIIECLVASAARWDSGALPGMTDARIDDELIASLQQVTEALLPYWLSHSRRLRLSILERVAGEQAWNELVQFIERFGQELFTPRFLNLGNLRAILDQGIDEFLERVVAETDDEPRPVLVAALDGGMPRREAARQLETIISAIGEHYAEYKDFNLTTTQSDHGELLYMLLDFLRLKVRYERFSWNLRPVVTVHQVLVRHGRHAAAEQWRRVVAERTSETADRLLAQLNELSRRYGMRLATVADRLQERFVRALELDRLRALVRPAIDQSQQGEASEAFELFEQEICDFTQQPSGAGLDVPPWLAALENEVDEALQVERECFDPLRIVRQVDRAHLSLPEVRRQLAAWQASSRESEA